MSEETLIFTRSRSLRHNSRVICETLTLGHADCQDPVQSHGVPLNDGTEHTVVLEAESKAAATDEKPERSLCELANLHEAWQRSQGLHDMKENASSLTKWQRRGMLRWFQKFLLCRNRPNVIDPAGRRRYAFAQSSRLLPHSAPILLPFRRHSSPFNIKSAMLVKASSVVPSINSLNKVGASLVDDPSSPRVTCLGRIKTTQDDRDRGKSSALHQSSTLGLMSRDKGAGVTESFDSLSNRHKALIKVLMAPDMSVAVDCGARNKGGGSSGLPFTERLPNESLRKIADLGFRLTSKKSIRSWNCNEEMLGFHPGERHGDFVAFAEASHCETDDCINSSELGSAMQRSWPNDGPLELEDEAARQLTGQIPPCDALLRMKNFSTNYGKRLEQAMEKKSTIPDSFIKARSDMAESICEGHERGFSVRASSSKPPISQKTRCSGAICSQDILPTKTNFAEVLERLNRAWNDGVDEPSYPLSEAAVYLKASPPNAQLCIWQRRASRKPDALEIGRPNSSQRQHLP